MNQSSSIGDVDPKDEIKQLIKGGKSLKIWKGDESLDLNHPRYI